MEGRSQVALDAARKLVASVPRELAQAIPDLQGFLPVPLYALVRFGKWDEILAEPVPPNEFLFEQAMWHYARGLALAATGHVDDATAEAARLEELATSEEGQALAVSYGPQLLSIANTILAAELAGAHGDEDEMISLLTSAVEMEDALAYFEPPYWYYPVRHSLGAALLKADRLTEAEVVYREDLKRNPENAWALFGLVESLSAQGELKDAMVIEGRFERAWQHADVTPTSSLY